MNTAMAILLVVIAFIVSGALFGFILFKAGVKYRKRIAEAEIGSAEDQVRRMLEEAEKDAQALKKQTILDAKDEIYQLRSEVENEIKDRRSEVSHLERRVQQREEAIDHKTQQLEQKEEAIQLKLKNADETIEEAESIKNNQLEILEKISNMTADQAKTQLLERFEAELIHVKAVRLRANEQKIKDESDLKARNLIGMAISRCATDHVSESTVSVVVLPNDEMKGRVIGREGRNIRAIETLTGVDLIIDDTPEAITLSCFDPVRREIARQTLERLISDGRIHPSRIEEMVEKSQQNVNQTIRQEGEHAVMDANVQGIHSELVQLLGRLKYRTSYGQNVLNHSMEVAYLSGMLASELHVDAALARRAGLLHDIGKALNHEIEGSHVDIGVEVCKKYKENVQIIHAIAAHHGDVDAQSTLAYIVQAADAISAARPGARRENLESYIKRLEKLEEIATSFDGISDAFAIQAGRELRIMIKPEVIQDDKMALIAHEIASRIENELNYPSQVKVNLIRESRVVDYAK